MASPNPNGWQERFRIEGYTQDAEDLGEDFKTLGFEPAMRQLYQGTLEGFKEKAKTSYVSPMFFAAVYAKLGDKDQTLAWLEKGWAERSPALQALRKDPHYDNLRSDPRFVAFLARLDAQR